MGNKRKHKIRFGIMCSGTTYSKWQAEAITKLLANKNVECSLLIVNNDRFSVLKNILGRFKFNNIIWYIFSFYLELTSKSSKRVDLTKLLSGISSIGCRVTKKGRFSHYFNKKDIATIKDYRLDFILRFGFGIIKGDILKSAKYGVWSYHHGDEKKYRGGPPCFWEIYNKDNVTGAILQRLTDRLDAGIVLKKASLKTDYSLRKNRDQISFESAKWPAYVCSDILNGSASYLNSAPSTTNAPIYFLPTNIQFIKFLFTAIIMQAVYTFKLILYADRWNIGVIEKPIQAFLKKDRKFKIQWFSNNLKNNYVADPFAIFENNQHHIFFEEFSYKKHKGHISYINFKDGKFNRSVPIIKEPFHLSYPYLFKHKDSYYLVPESYEANKIILYKAVKFPFKWKREKLLIDNFVGLDNTIFFYNKTWWLFSSNLHYSENSNLYLFYSDNLKGKWRQHPQNPVKIDVSSSRSAGTIFRHNGKLYRPSMDCSEKYGGGVTLNRIITITKTEYREVEETKIGSFKGSLFPDGVHNLSQSGQFTVIDGYKSHFVLNDIKLFRHNLFKIKNRLYSRKFYNNGDLFASR